MTLKAFIRRPSWQKEVLGVMAWFLLIALLGWRQLRDEYLLSLNARTTIATVISKKSGHGYIEYEYLVDGKRYEGRTPYATTGKPFEQVEIGDKLDVLFSPTHPSASGTAESKEAVTSSMAFIVSVILVASFWVLARHRARQ